ncbi:HlyD family secretion protein [Agaribacterium haliotis]|uniref:HlyD family secretion protein n=1 Tax=Agaribacterium haliotis TaxID=2013869 RepID=UPI000BB54590|nr:HlyD family efflux transporter periplasmic adaptor subunit [Agaribacterium haliotis]
MMRNQVTFSFIFLLLLSACSQEPGRALGTLERDRVVLKATASELIVEQPVREGSFVEKGTLLVRLDDRRQKAEVAKAKADLANAQALWEERRNGARIEDIDNERAKVEGANAELTVAEKNYRRALELRQKKLNTQAELDSATARRDSALASLRSAEKQLLVLTNGTRKEELDQAEAQVEAAKAQLELEQILLDELSIVASRAGRLDNLPWNEGERVLSGTTVAVLLAESAPFARVYVPEPKRALLKVGARATVLVDGIDKKIDAKLRWISSDPAFTPYYALNERDRERLVYLAEFTLLEQQELQSGTPVEVILPEPATADANDG